MSALKSSMEHLHSRIIELEKVVGGLESALEGQQRDMFAAAPSNENNTVDKAAINKRLDSAIEKVEQLLKDGTN